MSNSVLIVEDDCSLREAICDTLTLAGFSTLSADNGKSALAVLGKNTCDMVVSDVMMDGVDGYALLKSLRKNQPHLPVLLMTAYADVRKAIQAIRDGAVDYLVKPFEPEVLVSVVNRFLNNPAEGDAAIIIADERSKQLFAMAHRVAQSDASVLITGESGTGKEVLARYIHDHSSRAKHDYVAVNCAAIPENMLEACLFGYEKGAFTGAHQAMPGKFEQAQHGTLLLDEITEMDLGLQAKLLRVLQECEVERLGSRKVIALDVRIIATSNRDLEKAVVDGSFREDLYYRLNVFPLRSLPLRERQDDIPALAKALLSLHARKMQRSVPTLTQDAIEYLQNYSWPGNVRELNNWLLRSVILHVDEELSAEHLNFEQDEIKQNPTKSIVSGSVDPAPAKVTKNDEYSRILDELVIHNGCRKSVVEHLGISPRTLRYKIAKMREQGIDIPPVTR